jgi:murein L,D-transpeptidase YcbB/YkuD
MIGTIASRSFPEPVGRQWRPAGFAFLLAGALFTVAPQESAAAAGDPVDQIAQSVATPQWIADGDERAALRLIELLETSGLDGLDPRNFKIKALKRAVRAAGSGNAGAVAKANALLDRALVAYATALRQAPTSDWIINDQEVVTSGPSPTALLRKAATAPSLATWIDAMPFMHHSYSGLRAALEQAEASGDSRSADLLRLNLQRARFLPTDGRYVLVNIAAQRLYMYEDGQIVDEMKVVVGKQKNPTPMMAATIKFTALNPYWYVPPDLTAERIAPYVVKEGVGYLRRHGYVVLSDWGKNPEPIDPESIDWQAVADGRTNIWVRQNPGPHNSMGRMKFMFPNAQGIYLHDTPNKELLNEDARLFSGGCVRLEDASRLAQWLHGKPLDPKGAGTEQAINLDQPVPVYLAYLTAVPTGSEVHYFNDIYGKDQSQLAAFRGATIAAR